MTYSEKISIIIPVYNVGKYLDECIRSICAQTYDNLEIILVDDGSTDNSGAICDAWSERDDRIQVLHQKNQGISGARNAGLERAEGTYIGFVDSDDMLAPDMYEQLYQALTESECPVALCAYKAVDEEGNEIKQRYEDISDSILTVEEYLELIGKNDRTHCELVIVMNRLYKRELLEKVRFVKGVIHEDEFFLNDILFRAGKVRVLKKQLYYYRQRQGSIMHVAFDKRRLSYYWALSKRMEKCKENTCSEIIIQNIAKQCIHVGIRFWLLASCEKMLNHDEQHRLYEDVRGIVMANSKLRASFTQKLLCKTFVHTPQLLCGIYSIYRRVKKFI